MKQKFHLEIVLLGIVSIISLVSILGVHSFEAAATINSINRDTNSSQYIVREAGNTTVTNSTAHVKIGLGPNAAVLNKNQTFAAGAKQTFSPTSSGAGINIGTVTSDPTTLTKGDVWITTTTMKYKDNNNFLRWLVTTTLAQTLSNKSIQDTLDFIVNTVDPTKRLAFDVSQITTGHTDTWTFPNANSTFMGTTITNDLGQLGKLIFGSNNLLIRNPASTYTTTLDGGAVTANQTLKLPAINGTDTIASLGKVQTFTANQTFANVNVAGNVASTKASGTFKITAPAGVAICIGTGC